MYKRHKRRLCIYSIIVFCVCYIFNIDYALISEMAVTIISIALAVYIAAASVLLGSPFAKGLKRQIDTEDKTKSSLGVLSTYLHNAGVCSVVSIVVSCLYIISPSISVPFHIKALQNLLAFKNVAINLFSSLSCTLFCMNVFFLWHIFEFLVNSLTKSVDLREK